MVNVSSHRQEQQWGVGLGQCQLTQTVVGLQRIETEAVVLGTNSTKENKVSTFLHLNPLLNIAHSFTEQGRVI